MGYAWDVWIRLTPTDGIQRAFALSAVLETVPRPTEVELSYGLDQVSRQDVNRTERPLVLGVRAEARLSFAVAGDMADHRVVAELVNAHLRRWTIELSLDAAQRWREVTLVKVSGPKPFRGKPFAGAEWEVTLRAVDLDAEVEPIASGRW